MFANISLFTRVIFFRIRIVLVLPIVWLYFVGHGTIEEVCGQAWGNPKRNNLTSNHPTNENQTSVSAQIITTAQVLGLLYQSDKLVTNPMNNKNQSTPKQRQNSAHRKLKIEPLEERAMLSVSGLVEVGQQPSGALSGNIAYIHAGHGWTATNLGNGAWSTQRTETPGTEIVEDFGNQDQMTFLADYLFRAGATVVPLRPIGHQLNEIILDNDDTEVTFSGAWSNSSNSVFFGDAGDTPYRFASTNATETAYARYRPNVTSAGFYPVYSWVHSGSDRAADQLYRVHHSGGTTEVTVNHRRVGDGLVYLGTYHFAEGTDGYVDISNRSNETGRVVIADMIRFGNGMGDIDRGGGVSGQSREDETGLYWVKWHVDHAQGIADTSYRTSNNDRTAAVSFSPRYATFMNRQADGVLSDRVFVSFHSNAGGTFSRGVLGLYNGNNDPATATPNQFLLADLLAREVNDDLVSLAGEYEHDWFDRGAVVALDRADIEFGEINNLRIGNEFDATIIETGFHDNQTDAEMLRDPNVLDAIARATYQGIVRYFNDVDGGATPEVMLPGEVTGVRAVTTAASSVTVSWTPPTASAANGDTATGYRIYMSIDGYGFDGGTFVSGGSTASHTFVGLDASAGVHYFKVVAVNAGGESAGSEVNAALPTAADANILIVNGFDRLGRSQNPVISFGGGTVERVRPRQSNSFDYIVQVAEAMEAFQPNSTIDSTSNEAITGGQVSLSDYDHVFWILGEESTADDTFSAAEQTAVSNFIAAGGNLFLSGAEIGWDLDSQNNGRAFYRNTLHATYSADDANTYNVSGTANSIFAGLAFSFDDGSQFYNAEFADVITPTNGSISAASYVGGTGGTAAIQFDGGTNSGDVVMLAFPFETITDETLRNTVLARVMEFFDVSGVATNTEIVLDNDDGPGVYTEIGAWITSGGVGYNGLTYRFASTANANTATWTTELPHAGTADIFVQHRIGTNRATNAVFNISTANGTVQTNINQRENDLTWVQLGTFDFNIGTITITLDAGASTGGSVAIADAVRISLHPESFSADFDSDSDVDSADFNIWQAGYGTQSGATSSTGDTDADGDVDGSDFLAWQQQYAPPAGTAALLANSTNTTSDALPLGVSPSNQEAFVETSSTVHEEVITLPEPTSLNNAFSANSPSTDLLNSTALPILPNEVSTGIATESIYRSLAIARYNLFMRQETLPLEIHFYGEVNSVKNGFVLQTTTEPPQHSNRNSVAFIHHEKNDEQAAPLARKSKEGDAHKLEEGVIVAKDFLFSLLKAHQENIN